MKCVRCGFTHWEPISFVIIDGEDVCVACAGYEPPTCGNNGDF